MSRLTPELLDELVAEARLAPSIHNIQPTRWRLLADGRLALVDDLSVHAPIADPGGHNVCVSHGAALEGMSLALNRRGLSIAEIAPAVQSLSPPYACLGMITVGERAAPDPLLASVPQRMSWRGSFVGAVDDEASLHRVAAARDDIIAIRDRTAVAEIAGWADLAEYSFVRGDDYRSELVDWMRFSQDHPRYLESGLNREALAMNAFEATGARVVLGSLFPLLDRLWARGLAAVRSRQDIVGRGDHVVLPADRRGSAGHRAAFLSRLA